MRRFAIILFLCSALAGTVGCSDASDFEEYEYQAVSALGDTLYAPELQPDTETRYRSNLKAARGKYLANPEDADAIIWYGRRTAYLGNYRNAIDIFSEGVEKHPEDARMYRHRGHRHITIREFGKAVRDLEKASELIIGTEDQVEPDGIPNRQNDPRSTLPPVHSKTAWRSLPTTICVSPLPTGCIWPCEGEALIWRPGKCWNLLKKK